MKTAQPNLCKSILSMLAAVVALALPPVASAASITWGTPVTISGDTDVSTNGGLLYAYDESGVGAVVNTVTFAAGNSTTSLGGNVTISGISAGTYGGFGASAAPWTNLSSSYQTVLTGGAYGGTGAGTITLNNLVVGHNYQVQVWVDDSRNSGSGRNETNSSGNTVVMSYNNTGTNGGVGQYTIGTFTASATTQAFTLQANSNGGSTQINAIQVRDLTGAHFSGVSGSVWDAATTSDWGTTSGGPYNQTWTAAGGGSGLQAFFEGTAGTVSVNGAVSAAGMVFSTDGYTLGGSGTLTLGNGLITTGSGSNNIGTLLAGAAGLTKLGLGTLTLTNANTYTGGTIVGAGTLYLPNTTAGGATVNNGGTLIMSGSNTLAGTMTCYSGGTVRLVANAANTSGGYSAAYNATNVNFNIQNNGAVQLRSDSDVTFGNMASVGPQIGGTGGSGAASFDVNQVTGGNNNHTISIYNNGTHTYNTTVTVTGGNGYALSIGFIDSYNAGLTVNTVSADMKLGWLQYCNGLTKNGAGTLTMGKPGGVATGQTGTITVNAGTLKVGDPSTFTGAMALNVTNTAVFDLNGTNATVSTLTLGASTATITDNSSGTGTATLKLSNQTATSATAIKDGATRKVAVTMVNANGATMPFSYTTPSTFSGGLTLLNNASGTRLRVSGAVTTVGSPGAITSSPLGTAAITIGQAATDKAGILLDTISGINIVNNIIFNTALGTDQPGLRSDTSNVLSGTITANLAPAYFSSGGAPGVVNLTGQTTGSYGLTVGTTATGKSLNVILNNGTASANNYQGDTTVLNSQNTLTLALANQIPDGSSAGNVTDNGTLNLGGFNETINGLNGSGIVDGVSGTPTFTVGNNNATASFSGTIQNTAGTLALTKIGTGTQTLSGPNTYNGATTISAGMLQGVVGGYCVSSDVTVAGTTGNAATLGISITDNTMQWTCSSLTVNNAGGTSGLQFNFGAVTPSTTTAPLYVSGAVAFTTAPTITIFGSSVPVGNYPLLTWGSGSAPATNGVTLVLPRVSGHLAIAGNTLYLDVTGGSTEPVSWAGGNGTWDVNNVANNIWKDSASALTYYQPGDTVVFDNTVGSGGTVTLNANVAPLAITVANPSANYTISGTGGIAGAASLTKSGANTLTLGTANTYTGPTTVTEGTLALSGSLKNSAVTVDPAATLTENGAGVISGTASVTNSGTATLAGANTFSGGTVLSAGQLNINNGGSGPTNSAIGTGPLTIAGTGTIDNTSAGDVTIQPLIAQNWDADFTYAGSAHNLNLGAGAVTLASDRYVTVSGNTLTVGGAINGAHALYKEGSGTLVLSNYNTYNGGTTVDGGTLKLAVGGSVGAIRGTLTINPNATVSLNYVDALGYGGNSVNTVNIDSGTLANASGGNEGYNCSYNLNAGTMSSSGGSYVLSGQTITSIASVNPSVVSAPLTLRGNQLTLNADTGATANGIDLLLSGKLSPYGGENGALIKTGTGTVQLSGTNTFTGPTTNSAGTLNLACQFALQASTLTMNGGSLVFDSSVTNNTFTFGGLAAPAAGLGYDIDLTNNAGAPVALSVGANNSTYAAVLGGSGSLTKIGNGTLTLTTSSNTYSGGTTIGSGALALGTDYGANENVDSLGSGNVVITNGATLKFGGTSGYPVVYYSIPSVNSFTINNGVLNVTDGGQQLLGGVIVNSGGLTTITHYIGKDLFLDGVVSGSGPINVENAPYAATHQGYTHFGNPGNTYSGTLTIVDPSIGNGGALAVDTNAALTFATVVDNHTPSSANNYYKALAFATGVTTPVFGALAGTGNFALTDGANAAVTLTVGGNGSNTVYSGVLSGIGSLTKAGNGTMTLSNANTYTGNTTINGGTLEIVQPAIATNSTVTVASGAVLQLDFTVTNTVGNLVLGGSTQSPGVYNSSTPGGYITGSGSLLVGSSIATNPTNLTATVSGGSLVVSWPADHLGWILQSQTNSLATGLGTNWVDMAGSASVNSVTNPVVPTNPSVFYRLRSP